jgi:hypothetical protein
VACHVRCCKEVLINSAFCRQLGDVLDQLFDVLDQLGNGLEIVGTAFCGQAPQINKLPFFHFFVTPLVWKNRQFEPRISLLPFLSFGLSWNK